MLAPLDFGYHAGVDPNGQTNLARVREAVAIAIVEVTAKHNIARGDKRNQIAPVERSEHKPGDLVDI